MNLFLFAFDDDAGRGGFSFPEEGIRSSRCSDADNKFESVHRGWLICDSYILKYICFKVFGLFSGVANDIIYLCVDDGGLIFGFA